MKYYDSQMVIMFDVDDTLVMHEISEEMPGDVYVKDPYDNKDNLLRTHERHVKLLKDFKARGYTVCVWSAAGAPWAKAVVDALKLEEYVDIVMSKPLKYVDDLPANEILGSRLYLNEKGNLETEKT